MDTSNNNHMPDLRPLTTTEVSEAIKKRLTVINEEFTRGFEFIKKYPKSVSIFGSARVTEENVFYQQAKKLAARLSKLGYAIITGGGPGIMEAANHGASEVFGKSVGLNIKLPRAQPLNKYINDSTEFYYFFTRKVMLSFAAEAYIFFPGGIGTLNEFFELTELIQTNKIFPVPIILYGKEYWEPLDQFIQHQLLEKYKMITPDDLHLYRITDDEEEVVKWVLEEPIVESLRFNSPL